MRNQFYADKRDVVKWRLVTEIAGKRGIVWAVMMRPDSTGKDKTHGRLYQRVNSECAIEAFFEAERSRATKDLRRTSLLMEQLKMRLVCFADPYPQHDTCGQLDYFQQIVTWLKERPPEQRDLVFCDPDTGLDDKLDGKYLQWVHARELWRGLRKGDGLVVYQHCTQQVGWDKEKQKRLSQTLGVPVKAATVGDVCFLSAEN
jgi:hypothetical protein